MCVCGGGVFKVTFSQIRFWTLLPAAAQAPAQGRRKEFHDLRQGRKGCPFRSSTAVDQRKSIMETTASASSQGCHKNPASTRQPVRRRLPHPCLQLQGDAAKSSHGEKTGQLHNRARASRTTTTKAAQSRHYKYLQKIFPLLPREKEGTTKQLGVVIVATNSPTGFTLLPNQVLIWLISQTLSLKSAWGEGKWCKIHTIIFQKSPYLIPHVIGFQKGIHNASFQKKQQEKCCFFFYLFLNHSKSSVHT